MNHREQLLILALIAALVLLAILFPRPAASDVPVVAGRIPASDFLPLDGNRASDVVLAPANVAPTANPGLRLAGQGDPSGDKSPRRLAEARAIPTPSPSASLRVPTATPVRLAARTRPASVTGQASWFRSPIGVSAAGPALRTALGPGWRGSRVRVTGPAGSAVTTLGDWMAADRLIDLDDDVFPKVCGPLSRGICEAEVTP